MLIPNHPQDERLSALASGDPEAVVDSALSEHVASCHRCTEAVAELGALRASLAELPDLRPHRPLQLLPPVADAPAPADRLGGWARRFFAPVLTAGAALAMVGLVGTTAPLLGQAGSQGAAPLEADAPAAQGAPDATDEHEGATDANMFGETVGGTDDGEAAEEPEVLQPLQTDTDSRRYGLDRSDGEASAFTERSVWPMVLFAGVALMVAAALLRWILAPRAP